MWAIEDFVFEKTDLQPTDPVGLLFELFDVYRQLDPQVQFERFTGWASTLLGDFDRVDQYLVPAKAVFGWMSEARALARWQLDQAWKPDQGSVVDKHFRLFAHLLPAYEGLRQRLLGQGLAYRGMAYRALAERPYECLLEPAQHDFYYFAGFNAFSRSEETFVRYLVDKNKAQTLWDADNYYFRPGMEAGMFLQRYQGESTFGGKFNWRSDDLSQGEKHIQIIGVPNASMQPKVAGEIYRKWEEEKRVDSGQRTVDNEKASSTIHSPTAIVLGDENLLMPLLFSLDESVSDFNVTMGVSLRNSMLFTLVDAWFDAQRNLVEIRTKEGEVKRIPKFSHRHILRLLSHPFIRRYEAGKEASQLTIHNSSVSSPVRTAVRAIAEQNLVFLTDKELIDLGGGSELFRVLFTRWNDQPAVALRQCYKLVGLLREVYEQKDDALETEYLYLFFTLLKRLESLIDVRKKELFGMRPFRTLLFELIRQTSIPFSGEPVSDLQVMGMLETRALDFDRVIVLSVNEGSLPSGKRINSLIPFDAALEFGLPTHGDQDAVTAYHFFRLLQRAKEVVLIHTQPTGEGQRAEKSRFLLQIEHELARANPKIRLSYPTVEFQTATRPERVEEEGVIWKTPAMREFLLGDLAERGLYPSQLNNYL
ncbi:MAG: PD-(D/E)XK nuclease family protein, partial [Sphingobacteriaceae bacterium]|nr:PD-(D/E)XK nuclease family protein [Cytophagaceae bacterium]